MPARTKNRLHVVWCPKYRRSILEGAVALRLYKILVETAQELDIEIIALGIQPDHVHMIIVLPPNLSLSRAMQFFKGRSSRYLRQEYAHLHTVNDSALWARRYYAISVGSGSYASVRRYVQEQEHD